MLTPYLVLGVAPASSDTAIRERYLELVRAAARDPERLAHYGRAYEAIEDQRARVRTELFGALDTQDFELALDELVSASRVRLETVRLGELVELEDADLG